MHTLKAAGVAAIGFDVVFAESDRTAPQAMAELWPLNPALRKALARLPDHDAVFARQLAEAPVVIGFALERGQPLNTGHPLAASTRTQLAYHPTRFIFAGEAPERWLHPFDTVTPSLPLLEQAAQGNGALSFVPDSDGVVRRVPLVLQLNGTPVSTLAAETLRVGQGIPNVILKTGKAGDGRISEIRIGDFTIPTTPQGELWVHYSEAAPKRYLPAWQVLAGQAPAELLKGHLVLLGASAQGLMDLRFSPLGRITPGVEVQAQALEQILSGHFLQRPGWAMAVEALIIVVGGLLIGVLCLHSRALIAASVSAVLIGGVLWEGWRAFTGHTLLINTATPALLLIGIFLLTSLLRHFISEREQRWIKDAFSRYVSPNRVDFLVSHPDAMALGGLRQTCSFIFTDLAGFTTLMEKIDPSEAVVLLNDYLDEMIAIAFRHEGTLDRIVGDALAIMFSAPVPQADHAARALGCALEMDAFASRYAAKLQAKGVPFGKTRIGIHSGEVIVGNFGGANIFDYRALGDPVNTAARLESVNKHLGTNICLSEITLAECPPETIARPVGKLLLKGKSRCLTVYEPITAERASRYAPQEEYLAAYTAMAAKAEDAAARFTDLSQRYPEDPLVNLHHRRLSEDEMGDLLVMREK